jgi:hypothetical protein
MSEGDVESKTAGEETGWRFVKDRWRWVSSLRINGKPVKWYGKGFVAWNCAAKPPSAGKVQDLLECEAGMLGYEIHDGPCPEDIPDDGYGGQ